MEEKKEEKAEVPETNNATKIFAGVFLVAICLVLFVLVFSGEREAPPINTIEYNHFIFREVAGFWETDVQLNGQVFTPTFRFNPEQVEDLDIEGQLDLEFNRRPIHVTFNPEESPADFKYLALATSELANNLIRALNKTLIPSCTHNATDACIGREIANCGDAGKSVIFVKTAEEPKILLEGSCVTLQGPNVEIIKSVDRLLFQWYRIMQ